MTKRTAGYPGWMVTTYDGLAGGELTVTVIQQPLVPNQRLCFQVLIQADPDNVNDVLVGNLHGCYIRLVPGGSITITINDVHKICARSEAGAERVYWLAVC